VLVAQPHAVHRTGAQVLGDDIGLAGEIEEKRRARRVAFRSIVTLDLCRLLRRTCRPSYRRPAAARPAGAALPGLTRRGSTLMTSAPSIAISCVP